MPAQIFTIGVYGFTAQEFFGKITDHKIDTFYDIRRRRAVRGSDYIFANSRRLQNRIKELGIRYIHEPRLAPTLSIMALQKKADEKSRTPRRKRSKLSEDFINAYEEQVLDSYDFGTLLKQFNEMGCKRVIFFCVEREPEEWQAEWKCFTQV